MCLGFMHLQDLVCIAIVPKSQIQHAVGICEEGGFEPSFKVV